MQTFFANGKLLLTGEYVVLDGAIAIGLPSKLGQHLKVTSRPKDQPILWEAKLADGEDWFTATIERNNFSVMASDDGPYAKTIAKILCELATLNPSLFKEDSYHFTTKLDFPRDWGLGSSSTLLALLAKFGAVDAFTLSEKTFGGSGYDISCAILPKIQTYALTNRERKISFVRLNPEITQHLYLVHLNQKQNSREGIALYKSLPSNQRLIKSISDISRKVVDCDNLYDFEDLMYVHESLLSQHLQLPTVQERLFNDYQQGIVKSLGAWGGDFVLVSNEDKDLSYFKRKGYQTIIPFAELIVA